MTTVTDHQGNLLLSLAGWPVYVIVGVLAFLEWGRRVPPDPWDRIRVDLQRRAATTVVLPRFAALLRAIVPTAAGALGLPYHRFAPANTVGGVPWASAVSCR